VSRFKSERNAHRNPPRAVVPFAAERPRRCRYLIHSYWVRPPCAGWGCLPTPIALREQQRATAADAVRRLLGVGAVAGGTAKAQQS